MDEIIEEKFSELEKRYNEKFMMTEKSFDERFNHLENRISFLGKIPHYVVAALTVIILGVGATSFISLRDEVKKVEKFKEDISNKLDQTIKDLKIEIKETFEGSPNKAQIKLYSRIDTPLDGGNTKGLFFRDPEDKSIKLEFRIIVKNEGVASTDPIHAKVYYLDSKMFPDLQTSDEPDYAREIYISPDDVPHKILPAQASFVLKSVLKSSELIAAFQKGLREFPFLLKIYYGRPSPTVTEFNVKVDDKFPKD